MALITGLIGFSFTVAVIVSAAAQPLDGGARMLATAGASSVFPRLPHESGNPVAGSEAAPPAVSFSWGQAHGLSELRHVSAVAVYPFRGIVAGMGVQSFGFEAYRRLTAGAVVSTRITTEMRVGMRMTFRRVAVSGYGSRAALGWSVGWIAGVTEALRCGGVWRYVGAPTGYRDRLLPSELSLGVEARASPDIRLFASLGRETAAVADFRFGAEMRLVDPLLLRAGTGTSPDRIALGFGLAMDPASLDAGFSFHPVLGTSFVASLTLR